MPTPKEIFEQLRAITAVVEADLGDASIPGSEKSCGTPRVPGTR